MHNMHMQREREREREKERELSVVLYKDLRTEDLIIILVVSTMRKKHIQINIYI